MDAPSSNELSIESNTDDHGPSRKAEKGTRIEVKRLDKIHDPKKWSWVLHEPADTVPAVTDNQKKPSEGRYNKYADYAFIIRRKVFPPRGLDRSPTYLRKVFVW